MGRFRKTFTEALQYAKGLVDEKNMSIEKAAKNAAKKFEEDESQLLLSLQGKRLHHKDTSSSIENKKVADKSESPKVSKEHKQADSTNTNKKFEYNGPVDIICLNGNISTINICELVSADSKEEAKNKLYEKLFNNRLPIFIKENNFEKCFHEA